MLATGALHRWKRHLKRSVTYQPKSMGNGVETCRSELYDLRDVHCFQRKRYLDSVDVVDELQTADSCVIPTVIGETVPRI